MRMGDLKALLNKSNVECVVVLSQNNVYYYSGYHSSNAQIVATKDEQFFITDPRYYLEASQKLSDKFQVVCGNFEDIARLVKGQKVVGWDSNIDYHTYKKLFELLKGKDLVDIADVIDDERNVKSKWEIEQIVKAQAVTDKCFEAILDYIKVGVSEIDIASRLEYMILAEGCELAFDSIVAFGSNSAVPHAHRSDKKLQNGEFVLMDFGAKYNGYCSDMTRTVMMGNPSDKQVEVYENVLQAQMVALGGIKAGMRANECDSLAREYLTGVGLGDRFTHSLGHGLGIEIHEGQTFSPKFDRIVAENSVMSVEPGVYIDGQFGVRIEDIVVVGKDKVADLTKSNKKLIIL